MLWAGYVSLALAQRGLSSKAGGAPGERLSGSGCTPLRNAVCFVIGLYISRFFSLYTYLQRGLCASGQLPVCSSSALFLYLWSALATEGPGGRLEGGGRRKPSSASYGMPFIGGPGAQVRPLECDPDSGGLSSYLLLAPLAEGCCYCSSLDDLKIFYWLPPALPFPETTTVLD